tara:strand:+ start:496 stop:1515 length:1020 start_codon:yes stop_codon:yes gene_type:complete
LRTVQSSPGGEGSIRCSWLIPVRNGGSWLAESVASALTECGNEDEVVLVDDGSVDGAVEALPPHPKLRTLYQTKQGLVAALEHGRRECRGQYIARLDADDIALPGRLGHQIAALDTDSNLAAVGGRATLFTDRGPVPKGMQHYIDWINNLDDPHREILVESPLLHPAVTFRADQVEQAGGYRSGEMPEDYDLWLRLVATGLRIANVPHEVVSIRDHSSRLTRTDSRYSRSAFDNCRRDFLQATILTEPRKVVLWAGIRGGRPWLRWLQSGGHQIIAVIDIRNSTIRSGIPVLPPAALPDLDLDMLLVAVGARGARDQIRHELAVLRPDLVEGQNWWALL